MAKKNNLRINKIGIIVIAIIISAILYIAGVFTGLSANKLVKEETKKDLEAFENYLNFLDQNLKSMQLEESFMQTLTNEQKCNYSRISFNNLLGQISIYWDKLPFRLEEYEKNNVLTPQYILLKKQYTDLSIRTWLVAKARYEKCEVDLLHGLYFYSNNCTNCIRQGEELDELRTIVTKKKYDIIMFPIDYNSDDPIIKNLINYYQINSTPAVIVNDKVVQGRVYNSIELMKIFEIQKEKKWQ